MNTFALEDVKYDDSIASPSRAYAGDLEVTVPSIPIATSKPRHFGYRSISWALGFRERYSFVLCLCRFIFVVLGSDTDASHAVFIFGGALVGYCLARSPLMSPKTLSTSLVPGMSIKTTLGVYITW
jgi:hypothetical protein